MTSGCRTLTVHEAVSSVELPWTAAEAGRAVVEARAVATRAAKTMRRLSKGVLPERGDGPRRTNSDHGGLTCASALIWTAKVGARAPLAGVRGRPVVWDAPDGNSSQSSYSPIFFA